MIPERAETLEEMVAGHEARLNLLSTIAERQQQLLEEVQRDARHNRRMWTRVARRYGWLDDKDLFPDED